jgi:hypothetical protein
LTALCPLGAKHEQIAAARLNAANPDDGRAAKSANRSLRAQSLCAAQELSESQIFNAGNG